MEFHTGFLEIFMYVCGALFFICSVTAPIINKKSLPVIIASSFTGLIAGAYFVLCSPMLYELESNGDYSLLVDDITDGHLSYTVNFMIIIFSLALLGAVLTVLCAVKSVGKHKNKLFGAYAIVLAASFIALAVSLFTTYAQYNLLLLFMPFHFAFALALSAISMMQAKITAQFIKECICVGVFLIVSIFEVSLLGGVTPQGGLIIFALIAAPLLCLAAVIYDRIKAVKAAK